MALSRIIHGNFLDGASIFSEDTEANFGAANMADGRTSTQGGFATGATRYVIYDLGSSVSIDSLCIAKHNLGTASGTISIESGTSTSGPWTSRATLNPLDDSVHVETVSQFSTQYIRLSVLNHTASAYIGVTALGAYLEPPIGMPIGFEQPRWGDQDEIKTNMTRGNDLVGLSIVERPKKIKILLKGIPVSWFDNNWDLFLFNMKKRPFFFQWNPDDRPLECMLCWPVKKIDAPKYTTKTRCSASLNVEGFV